MVDEVLKRVFRQVADKHNVDVNLVEKLWRFQQKKTNELIDELGKEHLNKEGNKVQFTKIQIPYIGNLRFNREFYEKNHVVFLENIKNKENKLKDQS